VTHILALNYGSSSLKFKLVAVDGPDARTLTRGASDDTAGADTRMQAVLRALAEAGYGADAVDGVGHRVVHGGALDAPALIDDTIIAAIEQAAAFAPLHNAAALRGIREARAGLGPTVPMVAVFDTAFHRTMPEQAALYALPLDLARRLGIRRTGFHGLSHQYATLRYAAIVGKAPAAVTLVTLHLGNGCSAAAIANGRSVDTSMGFTPLEGLMMGTRSGDLDPALVAYLQAAAGHSAIQVERLLNEQSGLLGVSGRSADVRDLLTAEADGDERARLALEMFAYRARKYVGAYLAALGGADAVVFTGGIGEHAPSIRAQVCQGLEWLGLALDAERNAAAVGSEARISRDDCRLAAYAIPADEETMIARATAACIRPPPGTGVPEGTLP
jgi:acetate kinase